ncbi:MAG: OmpA family protein [Candidatus Cyclobacteriaceae bacterium M3_2C_046]
MKLTKETMPVSAYNHAFSSIIILIFCFTNFINVKTLGADYQLWPIDQDSLVKLEGKVFDAETKLPINATIFYEKLPYGNDLGIIHSKDSTGYYQFLLFPREQYKIYVKAKNYLAYIEKVSLPCQPEKAFEKNFYLTVLRVGSLIRLEDLTFAQGDHALANDSYDELDELVVMLTENPKVVIQLEGHTDYRGSRKLNHKLSEQRVKTVKQYLLDKGLHKRRIKTKAYGGSEPLSRENTEEAKKQNRRVEIRILKI